MNLRFFKKKDGSKVLQQQSPTKNYAWEDVPMVEEELSPIDTLCKAMDKMSLFTSNKDFSILMSESFAKKIYDGSHQNIYSSYSHKDMNSFYGRRVYISNMKTDFKFIQEVMR